MRSACRLRCREDVDDQQHERLRSVVTGGVRDVGRLEQDITGVEVEVLIDRLLFPLPAIATEYAAGMPGAPQRQVRTPDSTRTVSGPGVGAGGK